MSFTRVFQFFEMNTTLLDRYRHPGQGPLRQGPLRQGPLGRGPEPGFIIKSVIKTSRTQNSGTQRFGTVPGTKKIRYSVPGTWNFPRHVSGPVPTSAFRYRYNTSLSANAFKISRDTHAFGVDSLIKMAFKSILLSFLHLFLKSNLVFERYSYMIQSILSTIKI